MCLYCYCAESAFKWDPPWKPLPQNPWHPNIPYPPVNPVVTPPWTVDRLRDFEELLKRVKALEDAMGCECVEPDKPDYIKLFEQRIEQLEKRSKEIKTVLETHKSDS